MYKKLEYRPFYWLGNRYVIEPIREALLRQSVKLTRHFCDRIRSRGGKTSDLLHILSTGMVTSSRCNPNLNELTCRINGKDIEGCDWCVVVSKKLNDPKAIFITIF